MTAQAVAAALLWGAWQLWNPLAPPPAPTRAEVTACLGEPEASVRRIHDGAIFFCGRIDADAVARVRATLQPTDRALHIASYGGDLDAPIELGEIVRDHALSVSVVGPCISGCASFVFVASPRRIVGAGAVLAMHNTATSALHLARGAGRLSRADRPLEERARREAALYESVGVDPNLLLEPQARLRTLCVEAGPRDPRTGETRFLIHSVHGLWAPTRAQWQAHGVVFSGPEPAYGEQARRLLLRNGVSADLTVTLDRAPLPTPPEEMLGAIERCAAQAAMEPGG